MKQILLAIFFLMYGALIASQASAQHHHHKKMYVVKPKNQVYYYYPRANVYYNTYNGNYYYPYRNGWVQGRALPRGYVVANSPRYAVNHCGNDVYRYNTYHRQRYRVYTPAPPPPPLVIHQPVYPRPGVNVSINAVF